MISNHSKVEKLKKVWYLEKGNKNSTKGYETNDTVCQIKKDLKVNNCSLVAIYDYDTKRVKVYSKSREYTTMANYEWEANL